MSATFGKVEEFDNSREDWLQYEERLGHFFVANSITDAAKKRAVLLTVIGPATYKLVRNLVSPKKPGEVEFDELVKTLSEHFSPAPSEIVQRFKFNSRIRKPGESVSVYVAELRALAADCNFNDTLDVMLRDRMVCGINDTTTQRRLLAESKLTFAKALELAAASRQLHATSKS